MAAFCDSDQPQTSKVIKILVQLAFYLSNGVMEQHDLKM